MFQTSHHGDTRVTFMGRHGDTIHPLLGGVNIASPARLCMWEEWNP